MDIVASGFALLVLSPFFLGLAVLLRLTGEGEIFYRQERIGRGGKRFQILKFATMLKASPQLAGGDITINNDARILPLGRILRKTKINELPQLINVLRGDMSLIGPRPHTPRVAALFPAIYWEKIEALRPGLSGIGSIVFRDEEELLSNATERDEIYRVAIAPYKAALEEWYAKHSSLGVDVLLVVLTLAAVLRLDLKPETLLGALPPEPAALRALRQSRVDAVPPPLGMAGKAPSQS